MTTPATPGATSVSLLRWLPSPLVLYGAALSAIVVVIVAVRGLRDPDYFWHERTGRLIAETGQVPTVDTFSFTWHGHPWTAHEWLSELLIHHLSSAGGALVTSIFFGLVTAATFVLLAVVLHRRGVGMLAVVLTTALGAYVTMSYATVRPQAISWLFLAILLAILLEARADRPRLMLAVPPLFVLWANLHGLWVVGLGVLGLYVLFTLFGGTPMASARRWALGALIGAALASMLTPAGPVGILYPLRYVDAGDWGLRYIAEWQSPNFHDASHLGLLALILGVALTGGRGAAKWTVALSTVGLVMALLAVRNAPVAAVLCAPALAHGLEPVLSRWTSRRRALSARPRSPSEQVARRVMELVLATIVVAAAIVIIPALPGVGAGGDLRDKYPVAGVDVLERVDPTARVLAEYGWGGYVIWRLHDEGARVFVDGRNDMYDQSILDDYVAIRSADPGWAELVEEYEVEAILLPPEAALVRGPAQTAGWCEEYSDDVQILLLPCAEGGATDEADAGG